MDDYDRIKAVMEAIGKDMKLMIDANTKWDLEIAIFMSHKIEEFDIYRLDDSLNPDDECTLGESLTYLYSFRDGIRNYAIDIVQVNVTKVRGITEWLKVASLSEALTSIYPHTNIQQPLHAQLFASIPNRNVVEHVDWLSDILKYPITSENGCFHLDTIKGTGSEVK